MPPVAGSFGLAKRAYLPDLRLSQVRCLNGSRHGQMRSTGIVSVLKRQLPTPVYGDDTNATATASAIPRGNMCEGWSTPTQRKDSTIAFGERFRGSFITSARTTPTSTLMRLAFVGRSGLLPGELFDAREKGAKSSKHCGPASRQPFSYMPFSGPLLVDKFVEAAPGEFVSNQP